MDIKTDRFFPQFDFDIPRVGYFWLHQSEGSIFSRGIESVQLRMGFDPEAAKVTHVETCFGGPYSLRVWAFEKTRRIDIRDYYAGKFLRLVKYDHPGYDHLRYKVALWASEYSNQKYDMAGVLKFLRFLRYFIKENIKKGFCSEVCGYGLISHICNAFRGVKPAVKTHSDCMPAHFSPLSNPKIKLVWQGIIPKKPVEAEGDILINGDLCCTM